MCALVYVGVRGLVPPHFRLCRDAVRFTGSRQSPRIFAGASCERKHLFPAVRAAPDHLLFHDQHLAPHRAVSAKTDRAHAMRDRAPTENPAAPARRARVRLFSLLMGSDSSAASWPHAICWELSGSPLPRHSEHWRGTLPNDLSNTMRVFDSSDALPAVAQPSHLTEAAWVSLARSAWRWGCVARSASRVWPFEVRQAVPRRGDRQGASRVATERGCASSAGASRFSWVRVFAAAKMPQELRLSSLTKPRTCLSGNKGRTLGPTAGFGHKLPYDVVRMSSMHCDNSRIFPTAN